ncbi:MAG: phage holin family protein [Nocardioidaceae bacterium]
MTTWIVRVIADACGLAVAAWLFTGIAIDGSTSGDRVITLLVVALIFGLVNEFVRPIVAFLSIPLYVLTLGLMLFIVNALMLWLTSWVAGKVDVGFKVDGFWTAIFWAIVIGLVGWGVGLLLPGRRR